MFREKAATNNYLNIELWALRVQILSFWGGCLRALIFDEFLIGKQIGKILKIDTETRK